MVTHHPRTPQTGPPCEGPERRAEVRYTPTAHQALHDVQAGQVQYLDPGVLVVHGDAPDDDTYHALSALCFDGLIEAAHEPDEAGLRPMGLTDDGTEVLARWDQDTDPGCCDLHRPGCCDPTDGSPCCPECPEHPTTGGPR